MDKETLKYISLIIFIIGLFGLGIWYGFYQYHLCMDLIGNGWYCFQHAFAH